MGLGREEAIAGLLAEYEAFGALVRSLDEKQWEQPSRCEGWTAGDIARHVVGTATDVAAGVVGTHTPEEEVAMRAGRSQADVSDELDEALAVLCMLEAVFDDDAWNGPSPVPEFSMLQGILCIEYFVFVH